MPTETIINQGDLQEAFLMLEIMESVVEILVDCLTTEELNNVDPALRNLRDNIAEIRCRLKCGRNIGNSRC